jgi:hypothetical protein
MDRVANSAPSSARSILVPHWEQKGLSEAVSNRHFGHFMAASPSLSVG